MQNTVEHVTATTELQSSGADGFIAAGSRGTVGEGQVRQEVPRLTSQWHYENVINSKKIVS